MCCGVSSGADWKNSAWYKKSDKSESVPESCCKKMTDGCSKGNSSNIYQEVSAEDFIILYTDQLPGLKSNPVFLFLLPIILANLKFSTVTVKLSPRYNL